MSKKFNTKETNVPRVLRSMRNSCEMTMRQVAAMIGISHVAISQFENEKLSLPFHRVEQMVKVYGFTMDDFNKIIGRGPVVNIKEDCLAMLGRFDDEQLAAIRTVMCQFLRTPHNV